MMAVAPAGFADIGLTPELLILTLVTLVFGVVLFATVLGLVAAAVVGPRRPSAGIVPGTAGVVVTAAVTILIPLPPGIPWPIGAGVATAFLVALLQRALLDAGAMTVVAALGPGWWMLGGSVVGAGLGLLIGLVGALLMHDGVVVPGLVVIGAAAGAIGARPRREEPPAA